MKKIVLLLISITLLAGCSNQPKTQVNAPEIIKGTAIYGDSVINDNVIQLASLQSAMKGETRKDLKLRGQVKEVCQNKGCWMTMDLGNGETIRVTFKDYKIFVPKDLGGREVVLDGFAYLDTTSVENQQHYARDAGKSEANIAAIVSPKVQLAYEAKGVVVMN